MPSDGQNNPLQKATPIIDDETVVCQLKFYFLTKNILHFFYFPISCGHPFFAIQIKVLYTRFPPFFGGILLYKKNRVEKYVENLEAAGVVCYNNRVAESPFLEIFPQGAWIWES